MADTADAHSWVEWTENLKYVALGGVALAILPIINRARTSLMRGMLDINTLMTVAVIGAIYLADYVEACAVVILFALSDWLEMMASVTVALIG